MTVISTSPREADINWPNFWQTPLRMPSLLFSARVLRKFLTVSLLPPVCLLSSATMADLSSAVSVGVDRTLDRLGSLSKTLLRLARAFAVGSSVDDLEAAVY